MGRSSGFRGAGISRHDLQAGSRRPAVMGRAPGRLVVELCAAASCGFCRAPRPNQLGDQKPRAAIRIKISCGTAAPLSGIVLPIFQRLQLTTCRRIMDDHGMSTSEGVNACNLQHLLANISSSLRSAWCRLVRLRSVTKISTAHRFTLRAALRPLGLALTPLNKVFGEDRTSEFASVP